MSRTKACARRGRGGKRSGKFRGEDNRVSFDKVPKSNEKLERYYNQILGLSEEEKPKFWDALKRELPNSFRFAGSKSHALAVQKLLKERYIPQISEISNEDGSSVKPPEPVLWYPDELAWWMTTSKSTVRRLPPFAAFQKYLVSETSVGNISRQEVVSMIPPLVMDVKPGMTVLDMCAAPGSKAAQLLEMIHVGEEARMRNSIRDLALEGRETSPHIDDGAQVNLETEDGDFGRAMGLLIANDSDYKRSHLLIHQLKRLSSPNLIVTNHDATMYPSIKLPPSPSNPSKNLYLKFDRILADVPCSGDGTTRKNVNLWKDWNPSSAIGLHSTQVRILVRALQMLKVGGRVVYSTCSMNPVENEAVISSAIIRSGGVSKVKLLPCDDELPLLKRRNGLNSWSVMDKTGKIWSSWSEVKDSREKNENLLETDKLIPGMFPPTLDSSEPQIPLHHCMRIYAHLQDTGGFFIAILEKLSEFRTKPESEATTKKQSPIAEESPVAAALLSDGEQKADPNFSATNIIQQEIFTDERGSKRPAHLANVENEDGLPEKKQKLTDSTEIVIAQESKEQDTQPSAQPGLQNQPNICHEEQTQGRPFRNKHGVIEEPFKYIDKAHPEILSIESFYKLSPLFPRDRFMVRNSMGEPAKTIYYTTSLIRDILTENEGRGIKFVHGGVKMFMKQDVQGPDVCKWRIQSEGMPILEGYVGKERVVHLTKKETLRKLLIEMFPKISDDSWNELGEIGEQVRDIGMGCLVLRINPSSEEDGITERMVLPLWRSAASINLMLAKEDRTAMLLRMFNDTTPLINHSDEARAAALKGSSKVNSDESTKEDQLSHNLDDEEKEAGCELIVDGI
ncbi:Multisite-specific tRNA:-methyltransferase trm4a [Golovinomyces cichoracearum]|uniref:Multisite-specific tRNA:-methyltransferase trm4a n=1 Tax=Golovinomyces cichoracearum TaxID=62708 RepID=A0A420IJ16_9PEZI|nr:Multisite-specific tRNA:-methyltransferase trm4a [Golovinomyces cichoracearum]